MKAEDIKKGDKLRMADLRRGEVRDVIALSVVGEYANVKLADDDRARFRVGVGFLSPVKQ